MPDLPPLEGCDLLDYAETLLCNAVYPHHCSATEWDSYVKHWRDAKHGVTGINANNAHQIKQDCFNALKCLHIAVEESVANDVNQKVKSYITFLENRQAVSSPVKYGMDEYY